MYRKDKTGKPLRYAIGAALATALVVGCASSGKLGRSSSASGTVARSEGQQDRAIGDAEAAVAKSPREAGLRLQLAQSYLHAGRFDSAATTFEDAIALGDSSPRTALSMALAYIGAGRDTEAVTVLDQWRDAIPAGDRGLALALAGETGRGVTILADALRAGDASVKLRQNLAYAYALDGRWREARLMAAQDVPADQLDARISDWARQGRPEDYRQRVATMLGAPLRADPGQPVALALSAPAGRPMLAKALPAPVADHELPPVNSREAASNSAVQEGPRSAMTYVGTTASDEASTSFPEAFAASDAQSEFVSRAVVQPVPARSTPRPRMSTPVAYTAPVPKPEDCTHLVQLGSFSSPENAKRAWSIFVRRNPSLKGHEMQISEAVVRGRTYWRVAASGFDGASARSMCSTVKGRGGGCIAYAESRPLPGALPARGSGAMRARR